MISILTTHSRIFNLQMNFLTFAWAKPCVGIKNFRIPHWIPHPLILMGATRRGKKLWTKNRSKNCTHKQVVSISNPGIQPIYTVWSEYDGTSTSVRGLLRCHHILVRLYDKLKLNIISAILLSVILQCYFTWVRSEFYLVGTV